MFVLRAASANSQPVKVPEVEQMDDYLSPAQRAELMDQVRSGGVEV